jgi:hypothetical protein
MGPLEGWANFYVIVGSSAGALIGLMFVVVTLMSGRRSPGMGWGLATFNTPTIVHFSVALFIAATLSAPWPYRWQAALALGAFGLGGLVYGAIVLRRMLGHTSYTPVGEDWAFFVILPLLAYTGLIVAALLLTPRPTLALFIVAAALFVMIFLGIHNAWDLVTWITSGQFDEARAREAQAQAQAQSTMVQVDEVSEVEVSTDREDSER